MLKIPPYPKRLTLITLAFGMVMFVWIGAEDVAVWPVAAFGLALAALCAAHGLFWLQGRTFPARVWMPAAVLVGALIGAGGIAAAILLMLIKVSLQGHLYPDYTFPLIAGMAARLPAWSLAGALIGLAVALYGWRSGGGLS